MSDNRGHPGDELQLLLDGRLDSLRRAAVEAHLADCAPCRQALEVLTQVKAAARRSLPDHDVPSDLRHRVSSGLAAEAARMASRPGRTASRRRAVAWALSLAAGVLLIVLLRSDRPDPVRAAARDFERIRSGQLTLDVRTGDPTEVERFFAGAGLPFSTRVFDFGMMDFRLVGGRVHRLAGTRSALFAYQSPEGRRVVCQMYDGQLAALPAPVDERDHDGIRFRIYRRGDLTLAFWQEGSVVCVLISDGDPEAVIALAYAKAVKV
jgi:anti-sigma factor RsiW